MTPFSAPTPTSYGTTYVDKNADALWSQTQRLLGEIRDVASSLSLVAQGACRAPQEADSTLRRLRRAETAVADLRRVWEEDP